MDGDSELLSVFGYFLKFSYIINLMTSCCYKRIIKLVIGWIIGFDGRKKIYSDIHLSCW